MEQYTHNIDKAVLASKIDNTLLKPFVTEDKIEIFCAESKGPGFATVCVNPVFVEKAAQCLKGSSVKVCTVIGFPLGATNTVIKVKEAAVAIENGAHEIDMVINIGWLKSGSYLSLENEISRVVKEAGDKIVKVIIETCFLDYKEKVEACKVIMNSGAHFVKTSTGFGTGGATLEDIKLMKETVGDTLRIKASGGISNLHKTLDLLNAGAERIGTSSGVAILNELYY